jgi:hypothetical protein
MEDNLKLTSERYHRDDRHRTQENHDHRKISRLRSDWSRPSEPNVGALAKSVPAIHRGGICAATYGA